MVGNGHALLPGNSVDDAVLRHLGDQVTDDVLRDFAQTTGDRLVFVFSDSLPREPLVVPTSDVVRQMSEQLALRRRAKLLEESVTQVRLVVMDSIRLSLATREQMGEQSKDLSALHDQLDALSADLQSMARLQSESNVSLDQRLAALNDTLAQIVAKLNSL